MNKAGILLATLFLLLPVSLRAQSELLLVGHGGTGAAATYSDTFTRANGAIGSNWTEINGSTCTLQIISDLVYASGTPCSNHHALEYYTAGTFSNNQWTSYIVGSASSEDEVGSAVVRSSGTQTYNDADLVGGSYQIGTINPLEDFCTTPYLNAYSSGDTHELDVAGTGPVFFWSKRNGNVDASCADTSYNYTGGNPGVGVIEEDATPTAYVGAWQGGSLAAFSGSASDNFTRVNAGWLGVNWWLVTGIDGANAFMQLQGDSASLASTGGGAALWTTPMAANQSSTITVSSFSGGWAGAIARYTVVPGSGSNTTFYLVLYDAGEIQIYASSSGTFNLLSQVAYGSTPSTLELDATGTAPVSLTAKANGVSVLTFSDSTYEYAGTYAGFEIYGTSAVTVTGWAGANL